MGKWPLFSSHYQKTGQKGLDFKWLGLRLIILSTSVLSVLDTSTMGIQNLTDRNSETFEVLSYWETDYEKKMYTIVVRRPLDLKAPPLGV